ncbi:glycosyltransferase [Ornithinimicrobium cerasi]|uniref:Glycosyltransferase involved in cell wall bisynthesis n=1 Tax=Ornithinimicrobium cerasi TaxID=2248773 RepID=A0A285VE30_9MICO|nr:glycosyltransferase [Ornithinimicrobium cerasi]SOC52392.1 Glycosyltransferase involved in cell wall bisynthesis [Ornithinimicrobium cerasi]
MGRAPAVDVSVVTSGHDVADARLHRQVTALLHRGLSVEVLGLGRASDAPLGLDHVQVWARRSPLRRAGLAARMTAGAQGRVLVTLDPDSALAGAAVAAARGRRLVVDAHEDYSALLRDRPWARRWHGLSGDLARVLVRGYLQVARGAALTVVADDDVPPLRARNRLVLPNVPYPGMLPPHAEPDASPRAVYVGDVRSSRGLFAMLDALTAAPAWRCDVVGPVALADADELARRLFADPDLASRVTFHGRRPPLRSWAEAPGAWCGLLLLADTPAFRRAVPSKLHEYLACGLPVVSTDLPRQSAVLKASGAGALVPVGDDTTVGAAVADLLNAWAACPAPLLELRAHARAASVGDEELHGHYDRFADAVARLAATPTPPSPPGARPRTHTEPTG